MDGLFSINNFDLSLFNPNEIKEVYNNCGDSKDFRYLVMEVKYSSSKLGEMVEQLKKDHFIISNLIDGKVLYLGITNYDMPIHLNLDLEFDCKIIMTKKCKLFGRELQKFYDWKLIKRVTKIEEEVTTINSRLDALAIGLDELRQGFVELKRGFDELKRGFDELKNRLDSADTSNIPKRVTLKKNTKKKGKAFIKIKRKRDNNNNND